MAGWLSAQDTVARPKILGLAHVAFFVSDMKQARNFYEDFLGFEEEPFVLKKADGSERIAFIKINETQYVELFADGPRSDGQLNHISVYTGNADQMRDYLASKGVAVPAKVGKGQTGNKNFNIKDPDGNTIEIVEYQKDSWTSREAGKHMPDSRISAHLMHAGVLIGSLSRALKFYEDILGFKETWRGSGRPELSWVNLRVPDGEDYVEFMLYREKPASGKRGSQNHISLMVPDMKAAIATLEARPARKSYSRPIETKIGVNHKWQANFFDPDGTRVELMEPKTHDGKPAPPSTAPPPIP
jgi:catechol 2,3-dioxygenase-like lactoylglutathione lyase family enzyme